MVGKISDDFVARRVTAFNGSEVVPILDRNGANAAATVADLVSRNGPVWQYAYNASDTGNSICHIADPVLDKAYNVLWFGSDKQNSSGAMWRVQEVTGNFGPIGEISYRTVYGAVVVGMSSSSVLSALGFAAADTLQVAGTTITVVASGATGNQVNTTDTLDVLLDLMSAIMVATGATGLGDVSNVSCASNGQLRFTSDSDPGSANPGTTTIAFGGTALAKVGLTSGTYTFPRYIHLEGTACRFGLVPAAKNLFDVRACNMVMDGSTTSQHTRFTALCTAARINGYFMVGGGTFKITETIDIRRVHCDLSEMKIQAGVANATDDTGNFYTGGNGGKQPNIVTQDMVLWHGGTKRLGIAVRAGGNGQNSERISQKIFVWGDGDFDFKRRGSIVAIRWENDDSALSDYYGEASYSYVGTSIFDSMEKNHVRGNHFYCTYAGFLSGATSDTQRVFIHASICEHWWSEIDATDTSVILDLTCENSSGVGDGSPTVFHRNGKNSRTGGRIRASNAGVQIFVYKQANAGVDSLFLDNMTFVHGYGTAIRLGSVKHVSGTYTVKDWDNAYTGNEPSPAVWYGRMGDSGELHGSIHSTLNREGLRIGQGTLSTRTMDTVSGSPVVKNISDWTDLYVGQTLSGAGFPAGAVINSYCYGDQALTGNTTNGSATISSITTEISRNKVGMSVRGAGIQAGSRITAVGASSVTLDKTATATASAVALTTTASNMVIKATATNGSANLTDTSGTDAVQVGLAISGPGIPAGATIAKTTFAATMTAKSTTIASVSDFALAVVGQAIRGARIPYGTTIVSVNSGAGTLVMSNPASSSGSDTVMPSVIGLSANATATSTQVDFVPSGITMQTNATATATGVTVTPTGLYPWEVDLGSISIGMGIATKFTSAGAENAGGFPTTYTGLVVEKMKGGSIRATQCDGMVNLMAEATLCDVFLPSSNKSRYTFTQDAASTAVARFDGYVSIRAMTSARTLTLQESGTLVTNEGATAREDVTLPTAVDGLEFGFACMDTDGIRVIPASGDKIYLNAVASGVGALGRIDSTAIGSMVWLVAVNATDWVAKFKESGTWTVT